VQEFIDKYALLYISYDNYSRTIKPHYETIVCDTLQKHFDKGDIYKAEYTWLYNMCAERFLQEKDKVDGISPEPEFNQITEITETNYFFNCTSTNGGLLIIQRVSEVFAIYPISRTRKDSISIH
jgi:methionyl-tRNA synthetase